MNCGKTGLGTYGRTSSRFARAPGLSGTTTSHSYVLGVEEAILNCVVPRRAWDAVTEIAGRRAEAMNVFAMAFRRAAMSSSLRDGDDLRQRSSGVVGGFSSSRTEWEGSRHVAQCAGAWVAPVPACSCERRNCPPIELNLFTQYGKNTM